MTDELAERTVDALTLRFKGKDDEGNELHELRASHVAEVLQGVVGLAADFDKAGVFNPDGPPGSQILVRPAREGSFLIEVVRSVTEVVTAVTPIVTAVTPVVGAVSATGVPSLAAIVWWATKSIRAGVKDFDHLENGNVKVVWGDDTAEEIPAAAWDELQKSPVKRKKQLRQIMAPLADRHVTTLDVAQVPARPETRSEDSGAEAYVLERPDYDAARPDEDGEEQTSEIFETEAQMATINFEDPTKWRVKTKETSRSATVEDPAFLKRLAEDLAIHKNDIFRLRIREDRIRKNGTTRTTWTVLRVESHRRSAGDDDS